MEALERLIMVVKREALFREDCFEGFRPGDEIDYLARILEHPEWMERDAVEDNPAYKQPVAYIIIVNPGLKKTFAYQRSSQDEKYPEKRLQGKWSWGIGGHIEKFDVGGKNPIQTSALRELKEEIIIQGPISLRVLGYINDDRDEVGKVHFGILYIAETNSTTIKPKDPEIDNGRLRALEELDKICLSTDFTVEEWSRISLEPLKAYLQSL